MIKPIHLIITAIAAFCIGEAYGHKEAMCQVHELVEKMLCEQLKENENGDSAE